jgi:hypothetical protein
LFAAAIPVAWLMIIVAVIFIRYAKKLREMSHGTAEP